MAADDSDVRRQTLERLEALVGDWAVEVDLPGAPKGQVSFEWALDGQFLLERSPMADPIPDSLAIIAVAANGTDYLQHYFDARGVVRTYSMTLVERTWTMLRDEPDFSPLDFAQRFTGTFAKDGNSISATWEARDPGFDWRLDFSIRYTRESR